MMRLALFLLFCATAHAQFTNAKSIWSKPIDSAAPADGQALTWSASQGKFIFSTPSGTGTVTVVGAGSLTSTALVTGGGAQAIQTPSATATMDSSGNVSTPGGFTAGLGGAAAGFLQFTQGTAPSLGTTAVTLHAPASVTSYRVIFPGAAASGIRRWANSSNVVTESVSELSQDVTTSGSNAVTLATKYKTFTCQPGLGDGLNAIAAGTYLQSECFNEFGATYTITAIKCYTDNNGTSTLNVTNGAATALLTGAVTCTNTIPGASGTQSGTTTIASGDGAKFTFVADGTSKQATFVLTGTR